MKTILKNLLILPLTFTVVACEQPVDLDDEAAMLDLADDEADQDLDDFSDALPGGDPPPPSDLHLTDEGRDMPGHGGPDGYANPEGPGENPDDFTIPDGDDDGDPDDLAGAPDPGDGPLHTERGIDDLTLPEGEPDLDDFDNPDGDDDHDLDLTWDQPDGDPDPEPFDAF